jgi:hypothetical protein
MSRCKCIGWWQQEGYGRQPMHQLHIAFQQSQIVGSGVDMIAPFTLTGNLRSDGVVEIVKQYTGRHTVLYVGQYDGEGTLYGDWDIDGYRGLWSIKLLQLDQADSEREEYDEVS